MWPATDAAGINLQTFAGQPVHVLVQEQMRSLNIGTSAFHRSRFVVVTKVTNAVDESVTDQRTAAVSRARHASVGCRTQKF